MMTMRKKMAEHLITVTRKKEVKKDGSEATEKGELIIGE
jgi:hypothetical protein